jgi:hypothetical protein
LDSNAILSTREVRKMILIVSGISSIPNQFNNQQYHFQQERYTTTTKEELKEAIKEDFGKLLDAEISKLRINILI